jgi:hypothetical protein
MIKRNLSGVYFRYKNEETGKFDNVVFEDLPEEEQDRILDAKDPEWTKSLAKIMAKSLRDMGDQLDIVRGG